MTEFLVFRWVNSATQKLIKVRLRYDKNEAQAEKESQECMQSCVEEEAGEVAKVALSNTGSHPWTVMIVYFNAEPTSAAVVRSWRPKNLAC